MFDELVVTTDNENQLFMTNTAQSVYMMYHKFDVKKDSILILCTKEVMVG